MCYSINQKEAKQLPKENEMTTYTIVDIQTKAQVGKVYNDRNRARKQADRLDMQYGAVRFIVKPHFSDEV